MAPPVKLVEKQNWLILYIFLSVVYLILFFIPRGLLPGYQYFVAVFWAIYVLAGAIVVYFTIWSEKAAEASQFIIAFFIFHSMLLIFSQVFPIGSAGLSSNIMTLVVILVMGTEVGFIVANAYDVIKVTPSIRLVTKKQKLYYLLTKSS